MRERDRERERERERARVSLSMMRTHALKKKAMMMEKTKTRFLFRLNNDDNNSDESKAYLLESFCPGNSGYSLSSGAGAAASAIVLLYVKSFMSFEEDFLLLFLFQAQALKKSCTVSSPTHTTREEVLHAK